MVCKIAQKRAFLEQCFEITLFQNIISNSLKICHYLIIVLALNFYFPKFYTCKRFHDGITTRNVALHFCDAPVHQLRVQGQMNQAGQNKSDLVIRVSQLQDKLMYFQAKWDELRPKAKCLRTNLSRLHSNYQISTSCCAGQLILSTNVTELWSV